MPVIMGTAGHIDHGKTTLIKALTGIDCDRLAEEKKRGITIELGFAFLDLPGDKRLGVVDVPGHEKFVKNMVAGASGIDFVLLVIAADEGVMPQTREHLEICSLLGVDSGLVALTKADMVDEEWLELVKEDAAAFLAGTFLESAPLIPVSAQTGLGLEELRSELGKMVQEFKPRRRTDLFRLPVDRVFTMKGHGTVVTGTMISGEIEVGAEIVIYPKGTRTKVRGLESHGLTVEKAQAGRRTAVNLHGLEVADLNRGDVLARPGELFPHQLWDVELTCLSSSPIPLKHRTEVHLHHGSKEMLARLFFLDRDKLAPGETCLCQIRFPEPMVGVCGDRLVVRTFSPLRTVAGGWCVNPLGRKVKRRSDDLAKLAVLADPGEDDSPRIETQLNMAGCEGMTFAELCVVSNLESKKLQGALQDLGGKQKIFLFDKEERRYAGREPVDSLIQAALDLLARYHAKEPLKLGLSRGGLEAAWPRDIPPKLAHFLVERMVKQELVAAEQELLRLPDHKVSLASDQAGLREKLLEAYNKAGLEPPNLKDVLEPLGVEPKEAAPMLKLLQEQGELVKVKEDMFFSQAAVEGLKTKIVGFFDQAGEMSPADFKDLTGLSRKYTIALLEYLDREKMTVRVGDKRRLRRK